MSITTNGRRRLRSAALLVIAPAGVVAVAMAATAGAKSFTLRVAKDVHVTNAAAAKVAVKLVNTHESVAVGPSGFAVYTFQGETTHHLICKKTSNPKSNCWAFWPPVSVSSSKGIIEQSGISGKLGTFHNHGTLQLTLNVQPLYYFTPDLMSGNKHQASGDELRTFGSIWHIVKADGPSTSAPAPTQTTGTATNPYAPGY
jgi:predicted lipoprotein with Yx(FWY)xxD motif